MLRMFLPVEESPILWFAKCRCECWWKYTKHGLNLLFWRILIHLWWSIHWGKNWHSQIKLRLSHLEKPRLHEVYGAFKCEVWSVYLLHQPLPPVLHWISISWFIIELFGVQYLKLKNAATADIYIASCLVLFHMAIRLYLDTYTLQYQW